MTNNTKHDDISNSFRGPGAGDGPVILRQMIRILLVRRLVQRHLLPQIRRQVRVGLCDRGVRRLGEIAERAGRAPGRGVAVLDAGHVQQLLGHGGRDDARTAGGGDQPDGDRTALTRDLNRSTKRRELEAMKNCVEVFWGGFWKFRYFKPSLDEVFRWKPQKK